MQCETCGSTREFSVYSPAETPNWVVCETCLEHCAPGDEECHICGAELEQLDDDDIFGVHGDPDGDPLSIFLERDAPLTNQWCLICDSIDCECHYSESLTMGEIQEAVFEAGVDAYDPSGMCDSCVFLFTSSCEPYRHWLARWAEESTIDTPDGNLAPISGCENYRSY